MSGGRRIFTGFSLHMYFVICFMDLYLVNTKTIRLQKRYTEEDICHGTEQTLVIVSACPTNSTMFSERSHKKNCDNFPKCMEQQLAYHCVKLKEDFVEVCAPKSYIRGRCCALYDRGLGRVIEDFKKRCDECPVQYLSNDYEQAALCARITSKCEGKGTRIKRDCLEGGKHDSTDKINTVIAQNLTSNQTDIKNNENNKEQLDVSIIVPLVVSVIILLLAITIYCQRKNIKRICIVTIGGMKNVKENQNKPSLQITDQVLLENDEDCKMLPNNT